MPYKKVTERVKNQKVVNGTPAYLISREIVHLIYMGYPKAEVRDQVQHKFGIKSEDTFSRYYHAAMASLDERNSKSLLCTSERNIQRCNAIIEECYEKKDFKTALQAIEILNKMAGVYTTKVMLEGGDKPLFEIKIGND